MLRDIGRHVRLHPFRSLALAVITAWILMPYYFLAVQSVTPGGTAIAGLEIPRFLTITNFKAVLGGSYAIWPALAHSMIAVVGGTLLTMLLAVPAAYGLSHLRGLRRGRLLYLAVFVLRGVPPVALVIPYYVLFASAHLLDTFQGYVLALAPLSLPFAVWTLRVFFDAVPPELEEAAKVDGADVAQRFFLVVVPVVSDGIAATAVLSALLIYVDYVLASALTGTNTTTFSVYVTGFSEDYLTLSGPLAAATLIGTLPMVAIYAFAQRYMRRMAVAGIH